MNGHFTARTLYLELALLMAALLLPLAACTTDRVLGELEPEEEGGTTLPDAGSVLEGGGTACGDGVVDPGEDCDDGNRTGGDRCSAACKVEPCPGTTIPLSPSGQARRGTVSDDTSFGATTMESGVCGGANGKDLVYSFTSNVSGRAVVRLSARYTAILAVRKSCALSETEVGCKLVAQGGGQTEISFPIAADETAYVVVDGVGGESGPFTLDVEASAAFCGDGVATYPEQCDDGNIASGDGCSDACTLEAPDPGIGACPGIGYTFVGAPNAPKTVSFAGDVSLLDNTMGACNAMSGKDQAYAITPTIDGALTAVLHAAWPEASLHLRRECFASGTQMDCRTEESPTVPVRMSVPVNANTTYTLFVDSESKAKFPQGGIYTLDLTLSPSTCGNGVLETPEQCDDGGVVSGDGCSSLCALEPIAGIDECPGAAITFAGDPAAGPLTYRATASLAPLNANARSCVAEALAVERRDAVFRFQPTFDGFATIKAKGDFNLGMGLRKACLLETESFPTGTDPRVADNVACASERPGDDEETLRAAVTAGTTYYLVVESAASTNADGVFELDVRIEKSVCGNGRMEGGEECDDRNLVDGDTCSSACRIEPLGTPSRDDCASAEELALTEDPLAPGVHRARATGGNWNLTSKGSLAAPCGSTTGRDAFFKVVPPIDGVIQVAVDATYNVTPALRAPCLPSTGSGFLVCSNKTTGPGGERFAYPVVKDTPYWIIVDAATPNDRGAFTLDVAVKAEDCGDGVVNGLEECDDGNRTSGDGCSAICKLEVLAGVDTCPGWAIALSGGAGAVREKVVTLSTASLTSGYSGTCGGSSRDGVIAITSDITGTMNAQLEGLWGSVLYARQVCADSSSQLACSAYDASEPHRTLRDLSLPVFAGVPTYLFIDGLAGQSGPATLLVTVTP